MRKLNRPLLSLVSTHSEPELEPVVCASYTHPMTHIIDHIYLGSAKDADLSNLAHHEITYVLNVAKEVTPIDHPTLTVRHLTLQDDSHENLEIHVDDAVAFMDSAAANGTKILVHCRKGISRSAALVIAYLMRKKDWTFETALEYVKARRGVVSPNLGFMQVLMTSDISKSLTMDTLMLNT
eukprot:PhF_6_TR20625/c0_g1_i1/m.29720